jgi:hypothetical protein
MKSVYLIISLQALVTSALHHDNNSTDVFRSLRGKGMGMGNGMGMGHGGNRGSGRREMMQIIHGLLENGDKIEREVTETDKGIHSYTHSTDSQVSEWIKKHVEQMKALMEEDEGGIRLWDDLFEKAWQYHDFNHLTITEDVVDGVKVTHEVNDDVNGEERDCVVAIIHEHAAVVSKFITNGMSEAHSNHLVPGECNGL